MAVSDALQPLLQQLNIPDEFSRYEHIPDSVALAALDQWRASVKAILLEVKAISEQRATELSLTDQANVIVTAAQFVGDDNWIVPASQNAAQAILQHFCEPSNALLVQVLTRNIKPLFQSNPHPSLSTFGRKLLRTAGGPPASQDFYDSQVWKTSPGTPNIVSWCVQHIPRDSYENLWHLIIPPVMALLDDFEARYKLKGVSIVQEMLEKVPAELLKRTGVDELVRSSLSICLTHLKNRETPQLIKSAVTASLTLTLLTTTVGSAEHFNQLCALLGEGIIQGIWFYAVDEPDTILASLEALGPVLRASGIGNARYLKALIIQLTHLLKPRPLNQWQAPIQIASLKVISILIEECEPCMGRWKVAVLDALARCWVTVMDSNYDEGQLKNELRHTCQVLRKICPSVKEDYEKLVAYDREMFRDFS